MPLLWLSIAFLLGIAAASIVSLPTFFWLACAAASSAISLVLFWIQRRFNKRRFFFSPFHALLLVVLTIGAARYRAAIPTIEPGFVAWYNDLQRPVVVEGLIVQPPDLRDNSILVQVQSEQLHLQRELLFQPVSGQILARLTPGGAWRYGDRLRLEGWLETPPENEDFSYRAYLANQGIHSYMNGPEAYLLQSGQGNPLWAAIYGLRGRAFDTIHAIYPDPEASLLAGILLGIESGIPADVKTAFKDTGTTHLIAISGFNIAIIAAIFSSIFGRMFGRRWGAIVAILGIAVYTILVGAAASVVRAAIMGSLGILGGLFMRRQVAVVSLFFTAVIMSWFNPLTLWDIGFQLSFAATLGLVLYATPTSDWFQARLQPRLSPERARKVTGLASEVFLLTLAAQLLTMPLIVYHFGRVSLSSFIVNPLVLPAQPPLMILGGLSVILGMLWLTLGKLIGLLAWPLVAYSIRVIEWLARLPWGNFNLGEIALPVIILVYALIFLSTVGGPLTLKVRPILKPSALLSGLAFLTVFTWRAALSAPDGRLRVTVLDVGQGDAILIESPTGRTVLIDGGPSLSRLSQGLGRRLPPNQRAFDWIVVAGSGEEQVAALPRILERFPTEKVLWAGPTHASRPARDLQAALAARQIEPVAAQPGHSLDLGQGARLDVLTVGKRGAILCLVWDRFQLILPIGSDFDSLESLRMGAQIGQVSALLLADGGYIASNPPEWIANLRPHAILISTAADAKRENISAETLDMLTGYSILRTDHHGWIEISSDGEQMWLQIEQIWTK